MSTDDFWIRGGAAVEFDSSGGAELADRDIHVEAGIITEVTSPAPPSPDEETFHAADRILIPGLINAHVHSNDNFLRGRVESAYLETYMLQAVPLTGVEPLSDEEVEVRTLLGAIEAVRTGTTTVVDDCFHIDGFRPRTIDAVMRAYDEFGIRAWVTANLSNRPMTDTVPFVTEHLPTHLRAELEADPATDPVEALSVCESYAKANAERPSKRVRFAMAASGPQRCTDEYFSAVHAVAARHDTPFVTHVLETRAQALTGQLYYGETLVEHMSRLGTLGPNTLVVHGVWVTRHDVELIAQSGTSLVHNPSSNLRLGSGIAPISLYRQAGVNVALGTDGISTNDAQNLLLEMRLAAQLSSVAAGSPDAWTTAVDALRFATANGAVAVGERGRLGALTPGAHADIVLLDRHTTAYTPIGHIARNIAYSEYGQSVDTVFVAGQPVLLHGRLTTIDERDVLERARELAATFFRRNRAAFERIGDFMPSFEAAQARLARLPDMVEWEAVRG